MAMDRLPPLLEIAHVAHRLRASHAYVRGLIHDGKLRAIQIGRRWRIDEVDLERFIDAHRKVPARRRDDSATPLQQKSA